MSHEHNHFSSSDENKTLLSYMLHHNKHHEEELAELAKNLDEDVANLINEAIKSFSKGNEILQNALDLMNK